jgi:hypothetical protein
MQVMSRAHKISNLIGAVVPFFAFIVAVVLLWNALVDWTEMAVLAIMYVLAGFGVTVGFHRLLTHRSFQTFKPVEYLFATLGSMAVQGPVISWVADHRKHHAHTDEEGDPHSPHVGHGGGFKGALTGLWHAAHVDEAIDAGWSWQRVAEALGISKQAVHARHARRAQRAQDGLVVAGRAREAVRLARIEAAKLGAERVETDHLLLGLLLDAPGPVREALDDCGITCDGVRGGTRGTGAAPAARPPEVSPNTREVLEQSMREAVARGDARLDVEHLLLAILHEPGGRGQQAVVTAGRSPGAVERRLARALRAQSAASTAVESPSS